MLFDKKVFSNTMRSKIKKIQRSYSTPLVFDEFQQKFPDFQALTHLQWRVKKQT
jgi:hypothetical protein